MSWIRKEKKQSLVKENRPGHMYVAVASLRHFDGVSTQALFVLIVISLR